MSTRTFILFAAISGSATSTGIFDTIQESYNKVQTRIGQDTTTLFDKINQKTQLARIDGKYYKIDQENKIETQDQKVYRVKSIASGLWHCVTLKKETDDNKDDIQEQFGVYEKIKGYRNSFSNHYIPYLEMINKWMMQSDDSALFLTGDCFQPTLSEQLEKSSQHKLTEMEGLRLVKHLTHGLDVLHLQESAVIIHRDINPKNIMIAQDYYQIVRFDHAKTLAKGETLSGITSGNLMYAAPETLMKDDAVKYDSKADVWSMGVTIYEALTGEYPFKPFLNHEDTITVDTMKNAVNEKFKNEEDPSLQLPDSFSQSLRSLVSRMTKVNPENRISAQELIKAVKDLRIPRRTWFRRNIV